MVRTPAVRCRGRARAAARRSSSRSQRPRFPVRLEQGPWAWFRLLDQARVERESDSRLRLTFTAGGRSMRVILDAASSRNPFGTNALAGFSCAM